MALFSRRPKKPAGSSPEPTGDAVVDDAAVENGQVAADAQADAAAAPAAESTQPDAAAEPEASGVDVGSVSISVSAYGGLGAAPAPSRPVSDERAPAAAPSQLPRMGGREWMRTAPAQTETVPGLRDNVLLRDALGRVGDAPASQALLDVARQLMQGHVFLRVKGDARTLLAEGKPLPLGVANLGDRVFALAYSSGAALQASLKADGDSDTSAMGQPVLTVLQHVFASNYDGIVLDPASTPSRAVLPTELLKRAVEQADPELTVKTLLAAERTPEVSAQVAEALARVPLWVAAGLAEGGTPGLAEGRTSDGDRFLEVYSHPLEVAVMGRGDNAVPLTAVQLAKALRSDDGLNGVVVDPAGPWIRLTRDDLAPVLALAE